MSWGQTAADAGHLVETEPSHDFVAHILDVDQRLRRTLDEVGVFDIHRIPAHDRKKIERGRIRNECELVQSLRGGVSDDIRGPQLVLIVRWSININKTLYVSSTTSNGAQSTRSVWAILERSNKVCLIVRYLLVREELGVLAPIERPLGASVRSKGAALSNAGTRPSLNARHT